MEKHKVDAQKAAALGMLSPDTGIAALSSVVAATVAGGATAVVRGAAGAAYWHKLLANVKPTPPIFADVMDAAHQPAAAMVCCMRN